MFAKTEFIDIYLNKPIPEAVNDNHTVKQLFELVQLIKDKYNLPVVGQFTLNSPEEIRIKYGNFGYMPNQKGNTESKNIFPALYLQEFGTVATEQSHPIYSHITSTIITIPRDKIEAVKEGLKLLATPTEEEAAERQNARVYAAC